MVPDAQTFGETECAAQPLDRRAYAGIRRFRDDGHGRHGAARGCRGSLVQPFHLLLRNPKSHKNETVSLALSEVDREFECMSGKPRFAMLNNALKICVPALFCPNYACDVS